MNKSRLEAFTDAIVAIVVTILVLELPKPKSYTLSALLDNKQVYLVYIGTFVVLLGVWYQHHNLFEHAKNISRRVFWANALWLLIQSFLPYISSWMTEYPNKNIPVLVFLILNMFWALSYRVLYCSLKEVNKMPDYPRTRTITYIAVLLILSAVSLINITLTIIGLILFSAIGLIIRRDLDV